MSNPKSNVSTIRVSKDPLLKKLIYIDEKEKKEIEKRKALVSEKLTSSQEEDKTLEGEIATAKEPLSQEEEVDLGGFLGTKRSPSLKTAPPQSEVLAGTPSATGLGPSGKIEKSEQEETATESTATDSDPSLKTTKPMQGAPATKPATAGKLLQEIATWLRQFIVTMNEASQ